MFLDAPRIRLLNLPKDQALPPAVDETEEEFAEEMTRLQVHARTERYRARAASAAKKAELMIKHGMLRCERCNEDWTSKYGPAAAACMEIHHHTLAVMTCHPSIERN